MENYKKLNLSISPDNKIFQDYKEFGYKQAIVPNNAYSKSKTFIQYTVSRKYFVNEPIMKIIRDLNLHPRIFIIESKHCYNWHRDAFRNIAFNAMLDDDPDYFVAFAPDHPVDESHQSIYYVRTEEVRYENNKFILFNTQVPHITINLSDKPRYLLTIANYNSGTNSFKNRPVNDNEFQKTVEYLKKQNWV